MSASPLPTRDDWRSLKARADALPPALRQAVVQHWTGAAQLEHASVASFSRFSLQLMAVGAPASLIEDAHRAALDEIKHAELCFSLATLYAGKSIGPGPLPVNEQALCAWDLTSIAVGTVEEGCVGETIAALEAEAAAELAQDEAVRVVLRRIHEDEARHAELAWRFSSWAVQLGGAPLKQALRAAFTHTMARFRGPAPLDGIHELRLEPLGILSERRKHELREQVERSVLSPTLARLLG